MQPGIIGIDMGGTSTRLRWFAPTHQDYAAQLAALAQALPSAPPYVAVGVAVGARVLADGSGVAFAPNLRDHEGRDLRGELAARAGAPVWLAQRPAD